MTSAELCRENGWTVGTRLVGDEGYGPTVIRITEIGESGILAEEYEGRVLSDAMPESSWTLEYRRWVEVR